MNPRTRRLRRLRRNHRRRVRGVVATIRANIKKGLKGFIGVPNNEEIYEKLRRGRVRHLHRLFRYSDQHASFVHGLLEHLRSTPIQQPPEE